MLRKNKIKTLTSTGCRQKRSKYHGTRTQNSKSSQENDSWV